MSLLLETTSDSLPSGVCWLDQSVASVLLLLLHELINDFVLLREFAFEDLQTGAQPSVVDGEIVRRHFLFHHVIVEALTLLLNEFRPQLGHSLKVEIRN